MHGVNPIDEFDITAKGLAFKVYIEPDNDSGTPWTECDGHGPVENVPVRREYRDGLAKRPGQRPLSRNDNRAYDWQAAVKQARAEGWGPRTPYRTAGQAAHAAVQRDFDYLKAWCDDEWQYVGVVVALDKPDVEYEDSTWGVEYWSSWPACDRKNTHAMEVAQDIAESLATQYIDENFIELVKYTRREHENTKIESIGSPAAVARQH